MNGKRNRFNRCESAYYPQQPNTIFDQRLNDAYRRPQLRVVAIHSRKSIIRKLFVSERKILRKIFGQTKDEKTDHEEQEEITFRSGTFPQTAHSRFKPK